MGKLKIRDLELAYVMQVAKNMKISTLGALEYMASKILDENDNELVDV